MFLSSRLPEDHGSVSVTTSSAQVETVSYDLVDVWLLPDVTHPRASAQQMTGTFEWMYTVGDFENGTGQFQTYLVPWWGTRTTPTLAVTREVDSIEFTMEGNYHGLGLGVTLRPTPPLSPYLPSPLDTTRSTFDIEVGVSHRGHIVRGEIVPRCPAPQHYGAGTPGSGGFVPSIGSSGGDPGVGSRTLQIDSGGLLGGASCFLLLGPARDQLALLGITIVVAPGTWLVVSQQAAGTPGVAGDGGLQVPVPVPNDSNLIGTGVHFQVVALDSGSPAGVASATDGLSIVICH